MNNFVIYVCPECGRTLKWDIISINIPDLKCWHIDEAGQQYVSIMQLIYPIDDLPEDKPKRKFRTVIRKLR